MSKGSGKIKVSIIDNSPVVIRGLRTILSEHPEFEVSGYHLSTIELDEELMRKEPDLLIMEAELSDTNAKEMTIYLQGKYPKVKLIIFTNYARIEYVKMIMRLGAAGFILKNTSELTILNALRAVFSGEYFIDESVKKNILNSAIQKKHENDQQKLTKREKEILQLLSSNYNSQEISEKLFLSKKTVENHRANMLLKLKVKNAASLVMKAIELGLLE